ncbi:helix-turn-helix domain-containing protein [Parapedobacter sp. GCM10030251]|uniref:helix-turn-helix domain-containing protein n=1 Tax=Parapedobacter sp. GCM10030251 TaxID=3273419 RepID=UPI003616EFCE
MLEIKNKIESHQHLKIAEFRKDIRRTAPHKHHSYLEFIFLTRGSGVHFIDEAAYRVKPPVLFIVRKEQVHHWELEDEPEGYVLIIKKPYIDDSLDTALKHLVSSVHAHTYLPIRSPSNLSSIFELLLLEWRGEEARPFQSEAMEGLLKTLLAKILQQVQAPRTKRLGSMDTFQRFEALLSDTGMLRNHVAYYAERLNTTPQNLNAICRRTTGQSATAVLAGHILGEAKRLLRYTDMNLGEIASRLDFGDNSHFIKYFKRHVGITPNAFRQLT